MLQDGKHGIAPGKLAVVTTYLEMTRQADPRPATLTDDVAFRRVVPDLAWYRDIFTRVGGLEWLWDSRLEMADARLEQILADPHVEVFTLSKGGRDEALLELDFRQPDQCELAYFGLTPILIGSGAGRYLMNEAIARAWARSISRMHVHTCTIDSPQALPFYLRSGFVPFRREVEVWDDPRVTGLLPQDAGAHIPLL